MGRYPIGNKEVTRLDQEQNSKFCKASKALCEFESHCLCNLGCFIWAIPASQLACGDFYFPST